MAFFDSFGELVQAGKRYQIKQLNREGKRIRDTLQGVIEMEEDRYFVRISPGSRVHLGIPNEQDDAGESAILKFIPIDENGVPIESDAPAPTLQERIGQLMVRREEIHERYFSECDQLIRDFCAIADEDKLTDSDREQIASYVTTGAQGEEVESLLTAAVHPELRDTCAA